MPRKHKRFFKVGFSLVVFVVSLCAAEGIFRWSQASDDQPKDDSDWRARYRKMNETIYMRSDVEGLVYEPRPSSSIKMEYGIAGFNASGMRDDREFEKARSDKIRVALLGDSIVWSEYMSLEDSLPRQVEKSLDPNLFEVMNFGVSGYNTVQEGLWYKKAVRGFEPSIVVLVFCMNDMMIMSGPYNRYANEAEQRRKENQDQFFEKQAPIRRETLDRVISEQEKQATIRIFARLNGLFLRANFERNYVDEYTIVAGDPTRKVAFRSALNGLGKALRNDGAKGIFVLSPVLESWDDYHWAHIHQDVAEMARNAGLTVVDPLESWQKNQNPRKLRFPGDNLHYNPHGNHLLAKTLAHEINGQVQ